MFFSLCVVFAAVFLYVISTTIRPKNFPPVARARRSPDVKRIRLPITIEAVPRTYRNNRNPEYYHSYSDHYPETFDIRSHQPGPKWYPFVGCNSIVDDFTNKYGSFHRGLLQLSKEFSTNVLGIKLGNEKIVILYGQQNVHQVSMDKSFYGRPDSFYVKLRNLEMRSGITFANGALWQEHRQFTITQLKIAGFGKTMMEKCIQDELVLILEYLEENNKSVRPRKFLTPAVMNVLWRFVAGEQIEKGKWKNIQDLLESRSMAFPKAGGLLNLMPWCRFVIPDCSGYSHINKLNKQLSDFIQDTIDKHKKKLVKGPDFIYSFLDEMDQNRESFTEEQLKLVCLDLIIACQTITASLEFAFLHLAKNKSIQNLIHEDIDQALGSRIPSCSDKTRLVYTSACILELQRYYSIATMAGPRRALQDTFIDGYLIPKDTTVFMSLADIHADPQYWPDPQMFKPERFIDEHGMLKNSVPNLFIFGLGRRRCAGEALARTFMFLTLVGILQKYRIESAYEESSHHKPTQSPVASARPYTAKFVLRKSVE